ncbi:hypothetical protein BC941DRAFT_472803 [Chlamydoabsidia padenii]|nr:hypothetical protein BC941DRAFT_472803 [Chlamydoabsidia padenii]
MRSLRQMNTSGIDIYEPPSLRTKPRQKLQDDMYSGTLSGNEEMDMDDVTDENGQDSDNGSVFSIDEDEQLGAPMDEEELILPKPKPRQRQQQQQQQIVNDETTPFSSPTPHGKKRKLRATNSSHNNKPVMMYDDFLSSDDYDQQDLDLPFGGSISPYKKTAPSPLVMGSPSKVKTIKKQRLSSDATAQDDPSHNSSKWKKRQPITPFLEKLGMQLEDDVLDLSHHSIIPDDFFVPDRKDAHHSPLTADDQNRMDMNDHCNTNTNEPNETDSAPFTTTTTTTTTTATTDQDNKTDLDTITKATETTPTLMTEQGTKSGESFVRRFVRYIFG